MIKVKIIDGNIEKALKTLKRKVSNIKQNRELSERKEYIKPTTKNRELKKKAIYCERKIRDNDEN
jgi:ribosomal protein S21